MSSQRKSDPRLPGTRARGSQGTVERYAAKDVRELAELGALPPASDALRSAYRLMARQFDLAVKTEKTWDIVNASKELRSIRAQLLAEGGGVVDDDELERFLAALPATPRGYSTEP